MQDGFEEYCEQITKEDSERWRDGRCQCCGGKLLVGATDAEFEYSEGQIRRICFWCCDEGDPNDPCPSQFHYGHC
jgi:hypothetical protein